MTYKTSSLSEREAELLLEPLPILNLHPLQRLQLRLEPEGQRHEVLKSDRVRSNALQITACDGTNDGTFLPLSLVLVEHQRDVRYSPCLSRGSASPQVEISRSAAI